MPRTQVVAQEPTRAGLTPTFTAAIADGHSFANNGRTFLRFKNTSGSPVVVTVRFGGSVDGTAITGGKAITVPATTGDVTTGVWPKSDYDQPDGQVWIDYASPTGVSVAVLAV